MYRERRIVALVPAYNEEAHVGGVISTMPGFVDDIIVVNDASADGTPEAVRAAGDSRVLLIDHERNEGLGGSLVDAHARALEAGSDIMVVMAGDGQMDPAYLPSLLDPLIDDGYDFTKGNRFFGTRSWAGMPAIRVFGNIVLTFLTKIATGYWNVVDPQNGYTAMARRASLLIDWASIARDYSFENDVLAALWINGCRVLDVPIPAVYGDEVSDIRLGSTIPRLLWTLWRSLWRRIWVRYVLRSLSPVAVLLVNGAVLTTWGVGFGAWVAARSVGPAVASTGTVMLAVIPFMLGFELMLAAFVLDVMNTPT